MDRLKCRTPRLDAVTKFKKRLGIESIVPLIVADLDDPPPEIFLLRLEPTPQRACAITIARTSNHHATQQILRLDRLKNLKGRAPTGRAPYLKFRRFKVAHCPK
jgi:hypothetical protein